MTDRREPYTTFDEWYDNTSPQRNCKIFDGPQEDYIYDLLKRTAQIHDELKCDLPVYRSPDHTLQWSQAYISKRFVHLLLFLHQLGVRPKP